jgi:mannosyltransferase
MGLLRMSHDRGSESGLMWRSLSLVLILGAAAALRFYGLGAKVLWLDEVLSWRLLQFPLPEMMSRAGGTGTVHPPLYFLLLRCWAAMWGESELALRSLAAICGVLTVAGVYALVRELLELPGTTGAAEVAEGRKRAAALLAAALVALSPFQIHMARQARGYSLATALIVCSGWCLLRALRSRERRGTYWVACGLLTLASCYTHYVAIFSAIALAAFVPLYFLGLGWGKGPDPGSPRPPAGEQEAPTSRRLGPLGWPLAVTLVVALGFVWWLPALIDQTAAISAGSWQPAFSLARIADETYIVMFRTFANRRPFNLTVAGLVTVSLFGALLWLLIRAGTGGRFLGLTGLIPIVLILIYSSLLEPNLYYSRYLTFAQVAWLAGLGLLLVRVPTTLGRWAWATALLAASLFTCVTNWDVIGPHANPGMRGALAYVRSQRVDDEPLVVLGTPMFLESIYYAGERLPSPLLITEAQPTVKGSAHLRPGDAILPGDLAAQRPPGIWLVYRKEDIMRGRLAAMLPFAIRLIRSESFPQDYRWEGTVVVEYYRLDPTSRG